MISILKTYILTIHFYNDFLGSLLGYVGIIFFFLNFSPHYYHKLKAKYFEYILDNLKRMYFLSFSFSSKTVKVQFPA